MVCLQILTNPSDVLPWQCHARYSALDNDVLFIDVDYPDLIQKKRAIVLQTPELRDLLGNDFTLGDEAGDGLFLRSNKYCQLGCDLRQLDRLRNSLKSVINLSECAILFVAEVSITYMDTQSADSLIEWGSTLGRGLSDCLENTATTFAIAKIPQVLRITRRASLLTHS